MAIVAIALVSGCGQPDDPQRLLAQAKQSREKGDNQAAFIQLSNVLKSDPSIAEARYLLGVIKSEAGDYSSAEKEFRKALELGVDPAQVVGRLAWTLLMQEQYQKVLEETESAPE